jgi:endonuclease/exonuclease/phosphatase family metal-dependent hydrolase
MNGRADPAAFRAALIEIRPDVVAAQELGPNAAEVMATEFPHGRLEPSMSYNGVGIATRRPAPVDIFELPFRNGLIAHLGRDGWPDLMRSMDLVNVHLRNPLERPLGATRRIRRAQIAAIVRHVASAASPIAVVGDLNASPMWPAYRQLIRVVRDGVHDTGSTHRTWGPTWWMPRMLRIDHVLVRGGVRVTAARPVRIRGTDHSGLVVDVEVT